MSCKDAGSSYFTIYIDTYILLKTKNVINCIKIYNVIRDKVKIKKNKRIGKLISTNINRCKLFDWINKIRCLFLGRVFLIQFI